MLSLQADCVNMVLEVYSLEVLAKDLIPAISFMPLLKDRHIIRKVDILLILLRVTKLRQKWR